MPKEEFDKYRKEKEQREQKRNKAADDILAYIKNQQLCYEDVSMTLKMIKRRIRNEIIID